MRVENTHRIADEEIKAEEGSESEDGNFSEGGADKRISKHNTKSDMMLDFMAAEEEEEYYEMLRKAFPPNPLLPKNYQAYGESPRFGA